ncbi:NAD(P)/FAD-dependent oxidoreductase [Salinarchaeum laminariae]|uniref:NAD(P)/FAD-dependent oxidoreductase n=1 Tax=Salinarchaeum laminariae TaxID=869888 RepID=UPI0020C00ED1|nr:NAD(P)/FAD-dependent oxidoreductase [Salinarchaeum laminariae]
MDGEAPAGEKTANGDEEDRDEHGWFEAEVCIVGAGPAGLTAAIYTARAGLDTIVVDGGPSILERNAHLENVPGFPGGVDARRFLRGTERQAVDAGARVVDAHVEGVTQDGDQLVATTADLSIAANRLVVASWSDCSYLYPLDVATKQRGTKTFLETDGDGRTSADDVYAAGRIAGIPHQTVVAAGHAAEVAMTVLYDADVPFYHDWVTPEGYFTDRGRDVPPGCEEIDAETRRERESVSRERQRALLEEPPDEPRTHPSLGDETDPEE